MRVDTHRESRAKYSEQVKQCVQKLNRRDKPVTCRTHQSALFNQNLS